MGILRFNLGYVFFSEKKENLLLRKTLLSFVYVRWCFGGFFWRLGLMRRRDGAGSGFEGKSWEGAKRVLVG